MHGMKINPNPDNLNVFFKICAKAAPLPLLG